MIVITADDLSQQVKTACRDDEIDHFIESGDFFRHL
jgi:hypothetical protein